MIENSEVFIKKNLKLNKKDVNQRKNLIEN